MGAESTAVSPRPVPLVMSSRRRRRVAAITLAAVLLLGAVGYAFGAATVAHLSQTANGESVTTTSLTYWYLRSLATTTIPGTVPTLVSTAVASPTLLPGSGGSYRINAATAGDPAVVAGIKETNAALTNAELELVITVSIGGTPATSTIHAYVKTQGMAPGPAGFVYLFYFDSGTISFSGATITSVTETNYHCSSVGSCP